MSVLGGMSEFLVDHVMPRLARGPGPRNVPSREEIERDAQRELQARIDQGRPGPEEAVRRGGGPQPAWAVARPRGTRHLDVARVRLDALVGAAVPEPEATPVAAPPVSRRRRLSRQGSER